MSFLSTVFLLAALVSGILIPIFVGHGLAAHDTTFILYGVAAAAVAAVFVFIYSRVDRRTGDAGASH